jgi:hypothetical protein
MYFMLFLEEIVGISLYSIIWLVFVMCIYCI